MRLFFLKCAAPAALASMLMAAAPAAAQPADQAQPQTSGPMTVRPIGTDWVIAPEAKFTRFDGTTNTLAGVSGGAVIDDALFVGAAGYWLPNAGRFHKLGYGGLVVEWREGINEFVSYSLRGLLGYGTATVSDYVLERSGPVFDATGHPINPPPQLVPVSFGFRRDFTVAEPEANLFLNFSPHVRLRVGAGYRATGDNGGLGDRISGATGTVGLEFGSAARRP